MKNSSLDLRNHLFETIEALKDKENPMEIEQARAIRETAQTIINLAKVESEHARHVGGTGSGFLDAPKALPPVRGI